MKRLALLIVAIVLTSADVGGATLEVGHGKRYATITAANKIARSGDVIVVHPLPDGKPYAREAVYVKVKRLTIKASVKSGKRVRISGKGFDYSGRGSVPRAIFQFNRGADDCVLEGFELFGAANRSYNGGGCSH